MSRENVEIVRAAFEAWNAGDMVALRDLCAPNFVWYTLKGWRKGAPDRAVGRDAAFREFERLRSAWDADRVNLVGELIEAGDQVVGRVLWQAVGHGLPAVMESTVVFTLRDGVITRQELFWDHAEALEAAGLRE